MPLLTQQASASTVGSAGAGSAVGTQRTSVDTSSASGVRKRTWGTGRHWKKAKEDKILIKHHNGRHSSFDAQSNGSSDSLLDPSSANWLKENEQQQLVDYVRKMRAASLSSTHIDSTYELYAKIKDICFELCKSLLIARVRVDSPALKPLGGTAILSQQESSNNSVSESPMLTPPATRSSFSSGSLVEPSQRHYFNSEQVLIAIADWKHCVEALSEAMRASLLETYKQYEPGASPAMIEQLFIDKKFRQIAIGKMRNTSLTMTLSALSTKADYFPKYDIRFRNYDKVKSDLFEIRHLLQAGESGIAPGRAIQEHVIAPRGDAILEFANIELESYPALRFRVSSHMLSETSPIFERMFNPYVENPDSPTVTKNLPPPSTPYVCADGTEARLYRMPQLEVNNERSLELLLHAAHMHNDQVPRDITYEQFVAVAEVCMRYECTSPLELVVEHRWLPQWMHKATDEMPDGLLLISWAFGLKRLFTRMSKTAILNIVDEEELEEKLWPQPIKQRVWAVRTAKMGQVFACCSDALRDYIQPPAGPVSDVEKNPSVGLSPTGKTSCPKGSHACDAANLGWLMMNLIELQILPHIMQSAATCHLPPPPKRSLNQIVDSLRRMSSAPKPIHSGVCDFAPTFRCAIHDIYNSISGLTLYEIAGRHGWALSKLQSGLEPTVLTVPGCETPSIALAAADDAAAVKARREAVQVKILGMLDNLQDLHSAAMINKSFYETYKNNELALMRGIARNGLRKGRAVTPPKAASGTPAKEVAAFKTSKESLRQDDTRPDPQVRKQESDKGTGSDESSAESDDAYYSDAAEEPTESATLMTREEAELILWPNTPNDVDLPTEQQPPQPAIDAIQEGREKFRSEDLKGIEQKSLVQQDNKQLREERDRRVGLLI